MTKAKVDDGLPFVQELWEKCGPQIEKHLKLGEEQGLHLPQSTSKTRVHLVYFTAALMATLGIEDHTQAARMATDYLQRAWQLGTLEELVGPDKAEKVLEVIFGDIKETVSVEIIEI